MATCEESMYQTVRRQWRTDAARSGNLGFFGTGRDFETAHRVGRAESGETRPFVTKVPAVLEGHRTATVWVSSDDRDRIGLFYGTAIMTEGGDFSRFANSTPAVRMEPCRGRPRTSWPGGFVMKTRRPVTLFIKFEGSEEVRQLVVG